MTTTRSYLIVGALVLSARCFAQSVPAGSGYVFRGDINRDGIEDRIESGPAGLFGNGGGPFVVTIGAKAGKPKQFVLNLHAMAVTVENTKDGLRIWSYWHMSASEGDLCVDTLVDKPTRQCIQIYPGESGPELGRALYDAVFSKGRRIEFQKVENYKTPPNPDGGDWGK